VVGFFFVFYGDVEALAVGFGDVNRKFGVGGACGEGFDIILAAKSGDGPCEGVLNGEDCCAVFF